MHIVLVHGAGGTPTTWSELVPLLGGRAHTLITNPMTSLTDDVAHTLGVVSSLNEPVLLVGHSYGGAVITNVGRSDLVKGLVYVAAFAPDEGETVNGIVEAYPPAEVSKYMRRGPNGEWASEHTDEYWDEIGWDVPVDQRGIWDSESRPSDNRIFSEPTGVPAWRTKPSWYLVAAEDKTLPTVIQRDMAARAGATTSEVPGSHFTPRVRPADVLTVIEKALAAL
ncbi:pimeloyl-ACP methyl ester carboxylesterase [Actinoplanes tereljensis]|uniref:Alpha/beta hydrolase n=1 Tax=Paractinoplanes tereljensis TaxID=571912 RepID=A0A919NRK0_9ACTN|nr:alpha/beta hydrolase [Actinoplanes tereljensis]GIF22935.1 alpha/beta hydrolase [Actinoplanes tereljensis]